MSMYIYIHTSVYPHQVQNVPACKASEKLGQVWKDGARYQGTWRAGQFHGEGRRHGLEGVKQWFRVPSGYVKIAIENGHL